MLTELDRLRWKVGQQDQVIRDRNQTIQEYRDLIQDQQTRLTRQEKRIRNLRWDCLVLAVALIIAAVTAMKGGCW